MPAAGRVIGGSAGGIRLIAPRASGTRPITDRVKETLFGILGERVLGSSVADLYAGSGAIGIEALSRGAERCVFVERSRGALNALRQNLERTRLADRAEVVQGDVLRFLEGAGERRFDLALLDPPYPERAILAPLDRLRVRLSLDATVVVKHFWRTPVPSIPGLRMVRQRRFGETALTFLSADGADLEERR